MASKPTQKQCANCLEIKGFSAFSKNQRVIDGYANRCKECCKKYRDTARLIREQDVNGLLEPPAPVYRVTFT